jgi:hypothetical protein
MTPAARGALAAFKRRLAAGMGAASDHMTLIQAFNTWKSIKEQSACSKSFTSSSPAGQHMFGMSHQCC